MLNKPNVDSKKRISFPILLAREGSSAFAEAPKEIHVVPCGEWEHPAYGHMKIDAIAIAEFVQNFNDKVRRDLPITAGHDTGMSGGELPAIGWFTELINRGDMGLYATVKWTDEGKKLLSDGSFKYFSPEFFEQYCDPETQRVYNHVLVGGALTNKPYFKELDAVVSSFSEPQIINQFNDSSMDIKTILAKKASQLSKEEKAHLIANKSQLNASEMTDFAAVFSEAEQETEEQKVAREAKEAANEAAAEKAEGDANEAKGLNRDGSAKAPVTASEGKMVQMSEAEAIALRTKADQGALAFAELESTKAEAAVSAMIFNESNKENGRILPKSKNEVVALYKSLNATQRKQFSDIIAAIPKLSVFKEVGNGGEGISTDSASVFAEVENAVKTKIAASSKPMKYSDALKAVLKENPELAQRYEQSGQTE